MGHWLTRQLGLPSLTTMFEITGDHIAELKEEDLRSLVGLLCEDELRRRGLSVSAVTYSGDQNAKDGGLDVRVRVHPESSSFQADH